MTDRNLTKIDRLDVQKIIESGDLLTAASLCSLHMRTSDFQEFIDTTFIQPNPKPHEIHEVITSLGPDSYITTNYDRLIQDAYVSVHNKSLLSVCNDQPAEQGKLLKSGSSNFVFTPHGCAERCETIVLKREDYQNLQIGKRSTVTTLTTLMLSRPVVYIGFGLLDPDFLLIKDTIESTYRQTAREHFAIMPNMGKLESDLWRETYGVNIIPYKTTVTKDNVNSHTELLSLLKDLQQQLSIPQGQTSTSCSSTIGFLTQQEKSSLIRYCETTISLCSLEPSFDLELTAKYRKDLSATNILNQTKGGRKHGDLIAVSDLLMHFGNLALIGPPGSGKTHAVTKLALNIAKNSLSKIQKNSEILYSDLLQSIPLVLPMREYSGNILEMITERLPRSLKVTDILENGVLTLIIDAINEAPRTLFETKAMANDITKLIETFPKNKVIFTSRSINYVSFWPTQVFELQPITYWSLERYLRNHRSIRFEDINRSMVEILCNPLFLNLYLKITTAQRKKVRNAEQLLNYYFDNIDKDAIQRLRLNQKDLVHFLSPIAYKMVDEGYQTIPVSEFDSSSVKLKKPIKTQTIINYLVDIDLLVPDADGRLGFYHQSILEYLAAEHLCFLYKQNYTILDQKLSFLRWDETILIFVSLLPNNLRPSCLTTIANNDLMFACRAFDSCTFKDESNGLYLFDMVISRINDTALSFAEMSYYAEAMGFLAPYGRKDVLLRLLNANKAISKVAAKFLANIKCKRAIPRIIDLLLADRSWPSEYGKALVMYGDYSIVPMLLGCVEKIDDNDTIGHISDILQEFEFDTIAGEIKRLVNSKSIKDRQLAAEVLSEIKVNKTLNLRIKLLSDVESAVVSGVIFSFLGYGDQELIKKPKVVSRMFDLLSNDECGYWAADYLDKIGDENLIEQAKKRLDLPICSCERVNIAGLIAKKYPALSKKIIFEELDNNTAKSLFSEIRHALSQFYYTDSLFNDLSPYCAHKDPAVRAIAIDAISHMQIPDDPLEARKIISNLLDIWQKNLSSYSIFSIENALTFKQPELVKEIILSKLEDESYKFRIALFDMVNRFPLKNGEISDRCIEWLITKFDYPGRFGSDTYSPIAGIVGQVVSEKQVTESLLPLLKSKNKIIRHNAFFSISGRTNNRQEVLKVIVVPAKLRILQGNHDLRSEQAAGSIGFLAEICSSGMFIPYPSSFPLNISV